MTQPATLITQWADTLTAPVTLELIVSTKSTQADEMAKFARLLSEAAGGKIELRETKGDDVLPSLVTPGGITFHTLPGTKQLPFFLAALSKTPPTLPASVQKMAEGLTLPVVLDLFIAESCPFCPQITGQLIALATANTLVSLRIFDGTLFPEEAARQNIMSAPTLIYDNQLRWSGQFDLASAMEMI